MERISILLDEDSFGLNRRFLDGFPAAIFHVTAGTITGKPPGRYDHRPLATAVTTRFPIDRYKVAKDVM